MSTTAGLARPDISDRLAHDILATHFGVSGQLTEVGSQQDKNFRVQTGENARYLLKISNAAFSLAETEAQNLAMRVLADAGFAVPVPTVSVDGRLIVSHLLDGVPHLVRLLSWVDGRPLADAHTPSLRDLAEVGALAGRVSVALAPLEHPGLDRELQWDLRRAVEVVDDLIGYVADPARRASLQAATAEAARRIAVSADDLPVQAIHGDLTDDNAVWLPGGRGLGIIDFGDVQRSWRVAELAVACSFVLHHYPQSPLAVLPLVRAFDAEAALTDAEIDALWPLVVLRGATLAVSGAEQVAIDPGNAYARQRLDAEWQMFAVPAAQDTDEMTAMLRRALRGGDAGPADGAWPVWDSSVRPHLLDLGEASDAYAPGQWLVPDAEATLVATALGDSPVVVIPWGVPRLTRAGVPARCEPQTVPTFAELHVRTDVTLSAPFAGRVSFADGLLTLEGVALCLVIEASSGVRATGDGEVSAGDPLARLTGTARVWLTSAWAHRPAPFVTASEWEAVQALCLDPAPLLGLPGTATPAPSDELTRRLHSYSGIQSHYYADPPLIERGWREFLIDTNGRHYVDIVNNVAAVGHAHPRLAAAAADQWSRLNTNSRFHYRAIAGLSERLLSTLPGSFDTVLLVNSGSEAVDLAIRLARAHTGRDDILCVEESYHGWTVASDAVSTALSDNPLAAETRPDWVHTVDAPNAYRGTHRGEGAGAAYAVDAVAEIRRLAAAGRPLGAFIAEPRNGNAGAIAVPDGYLAAVYAEVRRGGGLAICDEVQVGYGRQGDVFWGYQQHDGVVPDIITVAKAMGNGHPLGAVITRREIAESLSAQGSFFSSAGGSTLSARIGIEVFDIIRDEGLQAYAAQMGARFAAGFRALADAHPLVGYIHGRGLYQGLELVRDRRTLEPATTETAWLCDRMRELGVIVQPTGDRQNVLKVKPPMCISASSVDHVLGALDTALTELEDRGQGGHA